MYLVGNTSSEETAIKNKVKKAVERPTNFRAENLSRTPSNERLVKSKNNYNGADLYDTSDAKATTINRSSKKSALKQAATFSMAGLAALAAKASAQNADQNQIADYIFWNNPKDKIENTVSGNNTDTVANKAKDKTTYLPDWIPRKASRKEQIFTNMAKQLGKLDKDDTDKNSNKGITSNIFHFADNKYINNIDLFWAEISKIKTKLDRDSLAALPVQKQAEFVQQAKTRPAVVEVEEIIIKSKKDLMDFVGTGNPLAGFNQDLNIIELNHIKLDENAKADDFVKEFINALNTETLYAFIEECKHAADYQDKIMDMVSPDTAADYEFHYEVAGYIARSLGRRFVLLQGGSFTQASPENFTYVKSHFAKNPSKFFNEPDFTLSNGKNPFKTQVVRQVFKEGVAHYEHIFDNHKYMNADTITSDEADALLMSAIQYFKDKKAGEQYIERGQISGMVEKDLRDAYIGLRKKHPKYRNGSIPMQSLDELLRKMYTFNTGDGYICLIDICSDKIRLELFSMIEELKKNKQLQQELTQIYTTHDKLVEFIRQAQAELGIITEENIFVLYQKKIQAEAQALHK